MIHHLFAVLAATVGIRLDAGNGGTVQASDGTGAPFDTNVGIRFNTDGTVEVGTSTGGSAINWVSHGLWIRPQDAASGNYSVRYTNRSGSNDFTSKAAAEDSWADTSTQRTWVWNETSTIVSPGNTFTCDFEVRDDAGSAATASDSYTFQIENST